MRSFTLAILVIFSLLLVACTDDNGDEDVNGTADEPTATATLAPETTPTQEGVSVTPAAEMTPTPEATPATEGPTTAPAETTPTLEAGTPEPGATIPDSPVGEQLEWILEEINAGGEGLTPDVLEEEFSEEFLQQVPAEQVSQQLQGFAANNAPLTFERFWTPPTPSEATAVVYSQPQDTELLMSIAIEEEEPHRIIGFTFQPIPVAAEFQSWDEFEEQFTALASEVSFLATEITEDGAQSVHEFNAESRLAIGSTFKLYVLGELAQQIEAGEAAWDEELAIQEDLKSLPSGTMQEEPAGETFTLQHYAELMISISDNTATDHLIHRLGRQNVEAVQSEMGHGEPELNIPFLTTSEMFKLKLAASEELIESYLAASTEEQRDILETEVAEMDVSISDAADWTSPRYIDEIEWFASVNDLREAMVWLHDASQQPDLQPLNDILSQNPGVPLDEDTWTWVGFKGGSEPGVLNLTWLLERADGRTFVMGATLNDSSQLIDEITALEQLMGAMNLLAEED